MHSKAAWHSERCGVGLDSEAALPHGGEGLRKEPSGLTAALAPLEPAQLEPAQLELGVAPVLLKLDVAPDEAEALRYLGYAGQSMGEGMAECVEEAYDACAQLPARGVFRVFEIARDAVDGQGERGAADERGEAGEQGAVGAQGVRLRGTSLALPGNSIARHLEGAHAAVLMAVTLGHESERLIRRETALSPVDGMFVDAMASSMAEAAMDALHEKAAAWAAGAGFCLGDRFSPGYGDLPLSVQPAFLEASGAERLLGITATDACLLLPVKSITAVAGLSFASPEGAGGSRIESRGAGSRAARSCETCRMAGECLLREQGGTCYGSRSE